LKENDLKEKMITLNHIETFGDDTQVTN